MSLVSTTALQQAPKPSTKSPREFVEIDGLRYKVMSEKDLGALKKAKPVPEEDLASNSAPAKVAKAVDVITKKRLHSLIKSGTIKSEPSTSENTPIKRFTTTPEAIMKFISGVLNRAA